MLNMLATTEWMQHLCCKGWMLSVSSRVMLLVCRVTANSEQLLVR